MRLIEWAFQQEIPTAEKLVLVWIATNASSNGIAPQHRGHLMAATGYKKRSIQRLLKSLRESGHLQESGDYFVIGPQDPVRALVADGIEQAPSIHDVQPGEACTKTAKQIDADAIGEAVAKHVIDAADYHIDQLQNFEIRFGEQLKRLALFHVEPEPPPPDPVELNPLYQELINLGKTPVQAYALSRADLDMAEDLDNEAPLATEETGSYANDLSGRYERVLDILHGSEAAAADEINPLLRHQWLALEEQENKHTVKGEIDAFEQLYPAIVAAAKANVGKMTMAEFLDPHISARPGFKGGVTHGVYAWDQELDPTDKDDPALMAEIAVMLAEIEDTNDPRCEVQPRTTEEGEDGVKRTETVLGYHRRVSAKHRDMQRLKQMGVIG